MILKKGVYTMSLNQTLQREGRMKESRGDLPLEKGNGNTLEGYSILQGGSTTIFHFSIVCSFQSWRPTMIQEI